ncbi:chemotaxis protein CheD [Paracoccus sediminicola]|uniref:chemotaxis protein CheD n=1 Tax=Paracoccus sediminicola TaxID=3017783 RepID=UPI0022F037E0|nr:chemotaxis protein CheD [Paracoccus sediminicola]WBU57841.1 chemotaxis protein CheD [Paracoccus sediminicola]
MSAGRVHVIQGQFEVSRDDPSCCLTTVLGSCISVCMFDPLARAGGMNHFLLASGQAGGAASASYGVNAMELLINALLKQGARRARLRAHVFGGANMMAGLGSIGTRNAEFVAGFLRQEAIRVLSSSTGGNRARRVNFWPCSGRVEENFVRERVEEKPVAPATAGGGVELF